MPLPNQNDSNEPLLHFPDGNGQYVSEHIPHDLAKLEIWLRQQYTLYRIKHNKDIYYWHTRFWYSPQKRKQEDIKFIRHVWEVHDGEPVDQAEQRWFKRLWSNYGKELAYVESELAKDSSSARKGLTPRRSHPYAVGYISRWYTPDTQVPEEVMLYHGIQTSDFVDLFDMLERQDERNMQELAALRQAETELETEANQHLDKPAPATSGIPAAPATPAQGQESGRFIWWLLDGLICLAMLVNFWINDAKGSSLGEIVAASLFMTLFVQTLFVLPYLAIKLLRKLLRRKPPTAQPSDEDQTQE
jgi:hypothetical protein